MQFELKVLNARREISLLLLDADTLEAASRQAQQLGHVVLSARQRKTAFRQPFQTSRSAFPLVLFSQELLSLLDAGLSLMESMETLKEKEHRPQALRVLEQVMAGLYEGMSLSQAMEKLPGVFPPLYVALVRSSEQTGDLIEALGRYVDYQLQVNLARKKIVSASIYPVLLMIVGLLVTGFLMFYVVPKFSVIYEGNRGNLPWMSQVLLNWGRMLHGHALEITTAFVGTVGLLVFGLSRPQTQCRALEWMMMIPALGERMRIYQLARFYRTLGMLLKGGIPVVTALEMVDGLLQPHLRARLRTALQDIREGQTISTAMESSQLTTPVAVRMLRVGERSGKMGEMMERIGLFYEEEIARWVDWFTRLFEPVLMTGIGLLVGTIVILMYMPIFELAGSIQ